MKTILAITLLSLLSRLRVICVADASLAENNIFVQSVSIASSEEARSAPEAPSNLTLDMVPGGLHLAWVLSRQDPGIVKGYEIVRATDYRGIYKRIGIVGKGISHYDDLSVNSEGIYFYKVRAIAGDSYSPFSNVATGDERPY